MENNLKMKTALTIAGSDSSGGAGIQGCGLSGLEPGGLLRHGGWKPGVQRDQYNSGFYVYFHVSQAV